MRIATHDLCLLTLNSGGLIDTINLKSPPKPYNYFNIIRGTSTSGHRVTIKGQVQRRFNLNKLERAIKEIIIRQGLVEDTLLKNALDTKCKVFVYITSNKTGDIEVGQATSAASSFFNPITIGDFKESFVNGAIGANNLVYKLSSSLKDKIKYLVLIRTGVPSLTPLLAIAIKTEKTVKRFSRDKLRLGNIGRYYRFNILRGLEDIRLKDSKQKNTIITAIDRYIEA
ncbi:FabD/lysophospholipase-like protein [Cenococcum geophilum]